jgi:arylformamidase
VSERGDFFGVARRRSFTSMAPIFPRKLDQPYGPDPAHKLDVYLPAAPRNAPMLFLVHGGAWMTGDKAAGAVVDNKVAHWVAKGYILVSTNYRLRPIDPLLQADDVGKALAFVQSKAVDWGGDPARLAVIGHSSGAHLVALLAADPLMASKHGARSWLGTLVLDSAALDVEKIMMDPGRRAFYNRAFRGGPADWRSASPIHRLSSAPTPMFVVCSRRRDDSCTQAEAFAARVKGLNGRAEVLPVSLGHREINEQLGLAGDYTLAVDSFLRSLGLP